MLAGGVIDTISTRQHLAGPDTHSLEVVAAGTVMHHLVPLRGLLQEARVPQVAASPTYIDSASTVFVAKGRAAPKKSAWIRRRVEVLNDNFEEGEADPIAIEDNFADPQTKRLTYKPWERHRHYTHNLPGDPPGRAEKAPKKPTKSG